MRQRRRRLASHSSKSAPTKSDEASEGAADKPKDGIDPLFLSAEEGSAEHHLGRHTESFDSQHFRALGMRHDIYE